MYKKASDNAQRQASQLWMHDLVGDCEVILTPEQERQNLVAKLHAMEKKILELPKGKIRSDLGKQKFELQQQILAIRPKLKGPKGVDGCFVELCREQLPAWQFKRLISEASKMAKSIEQSDIHGGTIATNRIVG